MNSERKVFDNWWIASLRKLTTWLLAYQKSIEDEAIMAEYGWIGWCPTCKARVYDNAVFIDTIQPGDSWLYSCKCGNPFVAHFFAFFMELVPLAEFKARFQSPEQCDTAEAVAVRSDGSTPFPSLDGKGTLHMKLVKDSVVVGEQS